MKAEAELKELHSEASEVPEEKKETRGRKKKEILKEEENNKMFGQSVSNLGTVSFGLLISRLYPEQPLNEVEEKSLNEAVEAVAVKYVSVVGEYKEETALLLALGFIFLPRYMTAKEKKKQEQLIVNSET